MGNIDQATADAILRRQRQDNDAHIFQGNTQRPFGIQSMTFALDTAAGAGNPFKISFPFKSLFVQTATDSVTTLSLQPDSVDQFQSAIPLKLNDSMDFNYPVSSAFLTWTAQSGKSITIIFFVEASFRSGSQISNTAGGVSISEGTAFTTSQVTLTAATEGSLCASNTLRKTATIQNTTGASLWVGPTGVLNSGSTIGIEVLAGGSFYWKNTAQLFGYSVGGGFVTVMEEA